MARPRVIVADTDESYVIPLQKKFAELFADKKEEENALLLPTAAHRFTVSEYIEHLPAYEMKGSGLPVQTPGLQKAAFLIM